MRKLLSSLLVAGLVVSTPLASLAADNTDLSVIGEPAIMTEALTSSETTVTETKAATTFNDSYGTWKRSGSRWWFQFADGSYASDGAYKIEGSIYAFDKDGWMVTGWGYVDEDWYYCNAGGVAQLGWQYIGGKWYYFDPESAAMIHGYDYGSYYSVDNTVYFFLPSGALANGWFYKPAYDNEPGFWLYFNQGIECEDWQYIDGEWYYFGWFNSLGTQMCANGWYEIDGINYAFASSGAMIRNAWFYDPYDQAWGYFDNDGSGHNGWLSYGGNWYFCSNGLMVNNTPIFELGNIRNPEYAYGFAENGVMITGWYHFSFEEDDGTMFNEWYHYQPSGLPTEGWVKSGNNWYYCVYGEMIHGRKYQTGTNQYSRFDDNGVWLGYANPPQ